MLYIKKGFVSWTILWLSHIHPLFGRSTPERLWKTKKESSTFEY
jgi:hypothetical protein